jgi:hypothetical protein
MADPTTPTPQASEKTPRETLDEAKAKYEKARETFAKAEVTYREARYTFAKQIEVPEK